MLANLFLHYAFDIWFARKYPGLRFVRYADDTVVFVRTKEEAETVLAAIKERLEECKLELNAEKTRIVYCKDSNRKEEHKSIKFDFLGYSFQPRSCKSKINGKLFLGFSCGISIKSRRR